jgi:hypothetical protein
VPEAERGRLKMIGGSAGSCDQGAASVVMAGS